MLFRSIGANILLKVGADSSIAARNWAGFSITSLLGLLVFGIAGILYAIVLRWTPLNTAQSLLAVQYAGVVLAAAFILAEPISPQRWLGILFIATGIILTLRV